MKDVSRSEEGYESRPAGEIVLAALTKSQRTELLKLARVSIAVYLKSGYIPNYKTDDPLLTQNSGAFVTLWQRGEPIEVRRETPPVSFRTKLRGCIGYVWADKPLYQVVQRMAVSAATSDPRLPALTFDELNDVNIEISVLSPLYLATDLEQIQVGMHGLMIVHDGRRGVLLPQVPVERGWNRQEFLEHLCLKAGLPLESWRNQPELYMFRTIKFGEE
jgi:AmmeMemoRadiSam system protein A